jgi:GLPGLI family protein
MKTLIRITVISIALLISSEVCGQEFQGIATYKTKRQVDIKLDSTQISSDMQKQMMEMLKKQFQKTFKLSFNKNESIYKEDESLSPPQVGGNMGVMFMSSGSSDILYKNTKENRFVNQNDLMGKIFLVKDDLQKRDWTLESDTKNIGEYTCYKATLTREIEVFENKVSVSVNKTKELNDGDKNLDKKELKTKTQIITAWYTPQIPVNNGPEYYQGLPGLILEVNDGEQTIICSKIVLNPEDKVEIKEPSKGKEVNQEEFERIQEKKREELMERFIPMNGRDGESIEIRIGG